MRRESAPEEETPAAPQSLRAAAVYGNSFRPVAPWVRSTGFRTHALQHRAPREPGSARLAEEFLINTRLRRDDREAERSIEAYYSDPSVAMLAMAGRREEPGAPWVALPESASLRMELGEVIGWRRSIRVYTGDPIELAALAALVRAASGVTSRAEVELMNGERSTLGLRATPSGGGLYPIDLHFAALRVEDLAPGLYRYDAERDRLTRRRDSGAVEELLGCFALPTLEFSIARASAVFLLVGQPWRSQRKYGGRGMRFLFLEAGAMAEHLNLAAAALGLGSVDCASVYDDEAHEVLGIDGQYETLLHTVIVGTPG